jgi:formylglycine-generating enzyme required for sulfatase activity
MAGPVFISHSSRDVKVARDICEAIERRGMPCWISGRDVGPGENFGDAIVDAIERAKVMVLVFSANANNSDEIKKEIALASQHRVAVIPVRVEDITPSNAFRYELATRQWIDMFLNWDESLKRLTDKIASIQAIADGAPLPPPDPPRPPPAPSRPSGFRFGALAGVAGLFIVLAAAGFVWMRSSASSGGASADGASALASAGAPPVQKSASAAAAPAQGAPALQQSDLRAHRQEPPAVAVPSAQAPEPASTPPVAKTLPASGASASHQDELSANRQEMQVAAVPSVQTLASPVAKSLPAAGAAQVAPAIQQADLPANHQETPVAAAPAPIAAPAPVQATSPAVASPSAPPVAAAPAPIAAPAPVQATSPAVASPSAPLVAAASKPAPADPAPGDRQAAMLSAAPSAIASPKAVVAALTAQPASAGAHASTDIKSFKDCETCPEMVLVPRGAALIGSPAQETARMPQEPAPSEAIIPAPFAAGRYDVTFDEWDACVAEGGCNAWRPGDFNWGRGRQPVIFVSWKDAKAYVDWLAKKTGKPYRLLSETEWEYAARGCATVACPNQPFWFGAITPELANYDARYAYAGSPKGLSRRRAIPADDGASNPFGLVNMLGNVRQWVEDCWNPSPGAPPAGGAARLDGDCADRVTRGGSFDDKPQDLRAAARSWDTIDARSQKIGFRVARALDP